MQTRLHEFYRFWLLWESFFFSFFKGRKENNYKKSLFPPLILIEKRTERMIDVRDLFKPTHISHEDEAKQPDKDS